ncbi:ACT domain-containing protein [Frigidibacter sp. MR17.14]|uniref:ACT domain-containing protein n=1 Tax=Frigidibacter sp. MR17.14 TaxID=3126509 RepID=UPI0030129CBA
MAALATTAAEMIGGMTPRLMPGRYVFASLPYRPAPEALTNSRTEALTAAALASFREAEGLSLILPLALAEAEGLPVTAPMRLITLQVFSALEGVGLTAAVAAALADEGIPCNMVAAHHHDHVFVPEAQAGAALARLLALQAAAGGAQG